MIDDSQDGADDQGRFYGAYQCVAFGAVGEDGTQIYAGYWINLQFFCHAISLCGLLWVVKWLAYAMIVLYIVTLGVCIF